MGGVHHGKLYSGRFHEDASHPSKAQGKRLRYARKAQPLTGEPGVTFCASLRKFSTGTTIQRLALGFTFHRSRSSDQASVESSPHNRSGNLLPPERKPSVSEERTGYAQTSDTLHRIGRLDQGRRYKQGSLLRNGLKSDYFPQVVNLARIVLRNELPNW